VGNNIKVHMSSQIKIITASLAKRMGLILTINSITLKIWKYKLVTV